MSFVKELSIMFRVVSSLLIVLLLNAASLCAAEFRLLNGDVFKGEAASINDDGLVVRLEVGGFSPRIGWGKLTQETLKEIAENPQAKEFVEPYIEIPLEVRQAEKQRQREIKVVEPPRVPLAEGKTSFFAAMANPLGYLILGALYLANLYAGFEIARFRSRPMALGVGLAAIAPVIGPLILLAMPSGEHVASQAELAETAPVATEAVNPMAQPLPSGMQASSLGLAAHGKPGGPSSSAYNQVYDRSNTTFDRRFFETKFTGFFRVVPGDAEKDLVLVIKTAKGEIVATRVTRVSGSDIHFQSQRGTEVSASYGEITQVSTRNKAAK
jgi:hypothetical protein